MARTPPFFGRVVGSIMTCFSATLSGGASVTLQVLESSLDSLVSPDTTQATSFSVPCFSTGMRVSSSVTSSINSVFSTSTVTSDAEFVFAHFSTSFSVYTYVTSSI